MFVVVVVVICASDGGGDVGGVVNDCTWCCSRRFNFEFYVLNVCVCVYIYEWCCWS